jgi:hypothetical protein
LVRNAGIETVVIVGDVAVTNCSNGEPCLWFVHLPVLRIAHAHLSSNNFPFKSHPALAYLVKLFQTEYLA